MPVRENFNTPQFRRLIKTAGLPNHPIRDEKRTATKTRPTPKPTLAAFTFRTCVYFWTGRIKEAA
jgi:hypothetical protein